MLDFHVKIVSLTRRLEPSPDEREQLLTEILLWPEISTFGDNPEKIRKRQAELAELMLKQTEDLSDIHERQIPSEVEPGEILLQLAPPRRDQVWRTPVDLKLHAVRWEHEGSLIVYVPVLGIEVISQNEEEMPAMLEEHIQTTILRSGQGQSLFSLAMLQRTRGLEVDESRINLYPETPKERWERSASPEQQRSELREVGVDLGKRQMPTAWNYDHHVEKLAQMLGGRRPMSVLLVGAPGVGKTAIVQELIRTHAKWKLGGYEFWKTSGARIVAGQSGFGDWQNRCQRIVEEARERNAILYLGNLAELLETGRAGGSSENIAGFFRPRMVRGELLAILECTPEQLASIEKRDPRVLDGVRQLTIEEPDAAAAFAILQKAAKALLPAAKRPKVAALRRIDVLHRRYLGYSAYPGKPIRFIERLVFDQRQDPEITVERVNRAFSAETGLPQQLLDESMPLDPAETTAWFRARLMGQELAVDAVVDTIAMIKAQLSRPGRPLASFLFVGPTGVGKTELAKCLAEFFYGSRERMIRFDMSEYNTPGSASRLVSSDVGGNEGLLTSKMRDEPFSVVLLDEFEKGDRQVFDLFLQVLGEARLTDGAGRVADFSNAIVIMTSNLGAASFRGGASLGFGGSEAPGLGAVEHFTSEAKKLFRPEFFNRIDRITAFLPLERGTLERIIEKEIAEVHRRDGLSERQLDLEVGPSVIGELLQHGYDPRYGARPLRRELEQRVLRRLAEDLNENRNHERGVMKLTAGNLVFSRRDEPGGGPTSRHSESLRQTAELRRRYQRLSHASFVSELSSELFRIKRILERRQNGHDVNLDEVYARRGAVEGLLNRLTSQVDRILQEEEAQLLAVAGSTPKSIDEPAVIEPEDYEQLLVELYAAVERPPSSITLVFQAERPGLMVDLAYDYLEVAEALGCEVWLGFYAKKPAANLLTKDGTGCLPTLVDPIVKGEFFSSAGESGALALEIVGPLACLWFRGESGGHEFQIPEEDSGKKKRRERAVIRVLEAKLRSAPLPLADLNRPDLKSPPVSRSYGPRDYSVAQLERRLRQSLIEEAERGL